MVIMEMPQFTKAIVGLLIDANYAELQDHLIANPEAGDVVRGGGGIRKIRWNIPGSGKSGGLRIIYYYDHSSQSIYMLWTYRKSQMNTLAHSKIRELRKLVEQI